MARGLLYVVVLCSSDVANRTLNNNTDRTVCMYVFIKLHITTQSGPVILVILCHSRGSMILITKTSDQTRQYVCMVITYTVAKVNMNRVRLPILLVVS